MIISFIVARDEQFGIGKNQQLLCHLPADLKYFKQVTLGHCVLMGRKTYDSIGRALPGRTNLVISRDRNLRIEGCVVLPSVQEAVQLARQKEETELCVIGGGMIFSEMYDMATKLYITVIHHTFEADTFLEKPNPEDWELHSVERHEADEKNAYPYTFEVYKRKIAL